MSCELVRFCEYAYLKTLRATARKIRTQLELSCAPSILRLVSHLLVMMDGDDVLGCPSTRTVEGNGGLIDIMFCLE